MLSLNGIFIQSECIRKINSALAGNLHSLQLLTLSNCQIDSNSATELLSPYKSVIILPDLENLILVATELKTTQYVYSMIESLLQIPKLA